jgi:hypothetical protein
MKLNFYKIISFFHQFIITGSLQQYGAQVVIMPLYDGTTNMSSCLHKEDLAFPCIVVEHTWGLIVIWVFWGVCPCGLHRLEHLQWCSVCDPAKIFATSEVVVILLFSNCVHKIGLQINRWETTNSNPSGSIKLSNQSSKEQT